MNAAIIIAGANAVAVSALLVIRRRSRKRTAAERLRESIDTALAEAEARAKEMRKRAGKFKGEARNLLKERAHDIESKQKELRDRLEEIGAEAKRVVANARP